MVVGIIVPTAMPERLREFLNNIKIMGGLSWELLVRGFGRDISRKVRKLG
jgi:hypothetical protein